MANAIATKNIQFYDDTLLGVQDKSTGMVYTVINQVLKNLGFSETQIRYQRDRWIKDPVISKGVENIDSPSNGGVQSAWCISIKKLPLALAKINVTPKMRRDYPNISEKLERYQDECADVLAEHFIEKRTLQNVATTPLTREELAAYMMYNSQVIDGVKVSNESMMSTIRENNTALITAMHNTTANILKQQYDCMNAMSDFIKDFCNSQNNRSSYYDSALESGLNSFNKTMDVFETLIKDMNSSKATSVYGVPLTVEEECWRSNAMDMTNQIASKLKVESQIVLSRIYNSIKRKDGIDLDKTKRNYLSANNFPSNTTTISIIAKSEKLRRLFLKHIDDLFGSPLTKEPEIPFSSLASSTPQSIWNGIKPLVDCGVPKLTAIKKVYKEMENIAGISLNDICGDYALNYNIKKANKGFVISQDEHLMKLFEKAVSNLKG